MNNHTTNTKSMISDKGKCKYLQILDQLNKGNDNGNAKIYTQSELSEYLKVSKRKLSSFQNNEIYDFWLLVQYAALLGRNIIFTLN